MVHSSGAPLSVWRPRSVNAMPGSADEVPYRRGGENFASLRERTYAGADVYRDSGVVAAAHFPLSGMHPRAYVDPEGTRCVGERLCTTHCSCGSGERGEEAVSGGVDLPASEPFEVCAD